MAKQCPNCLSCETTIETRKKSNVVEVVAKSVGTGVLAVTGFVTISIPGLHYVGLASMFGAGAMGKSIPRINTHQEAYHKCNCCGYKWK